MERGLGCETGDAFFGEFLGDWDGECLDDECLDDECLDEEFIDLEDFFFFRLDLEEERLDEDSLDPLSLLSIITRFLSDRWGGKPALLSMLDGVSPVAANNDRAAIELGVMRGAGRMLSI